MILCEAAFCPKNLSSANSYLFDFYFGSCSGCITSAKIVILEKQSLDEFLSHISSDEALIVSLSP